MTSQMHFVVLLMKGAGAR
jgi:hypothetical protein